MFLIHVWSCLEKKNPDKNLISFFQIKAEKYLTPQERERAEILAKLEMERRLIALVLKVVSFLLNRPLLLIGLVNAALEYSSKVV